MWFLLAVLIPLCFAVPHASNARSGDGAAKKLGYKVAAEMLTNSINFSADPCMDFFNFACGKWISSNPIPSHKTSVDISSKLTDTIEEQMRNAFESSENFTSRSMNFLKSMYRKCMDEKEPNKIGSQRLLRSIKSYGVWPMVDGDEKWRVKDFDLTSLMIHVFKMRGLNLNIFIAIDVELDAKNVSRRLVQFDQGHLGMGEGTRDYYLDRAKHGEKIEAYKELLIGEMKLLHEYANLPKNEQKITTDMEEIIKFETEIAKIMVPEEDRRNHTKMYNLRHLSDMQKLIPMVDWFRYFQSVAPPSVHKYFASNPEILVAEVDYMKKITKLLQSTDPRIITKYVFIRLTSSLNEELGERFEDVSQLEESDLLGKKMKAPRWKKCTSSTMKRMKYATGAIYVSKVYDQTSKNATLDLVKDLQEAFHEMLIENEWMDKATKEAALEKVKKMQTKMAYPDFILDKKKLDKYYDGITANETDSYSEMIEKLSRWDAELQFKRLIKPVDRTEYDFNAANVNAFYDQDSNSINFPAAILQAPFFYSTFPRALNYGGIGATIGHEITHGFDDEGQQYDAFGNLHDWWTPGVKKKFLEKAKCFINQYGRNEVPGTGLKLNGKLTQGENIADNGGVKQALKAYKEYVEKHGKEEPLEGLKQFSNEQMFFIGYAMSWCGHQTNDFLINQILTDVHSPNRYRVNQVLANQPEFAEAFKCGVGTPMNPTKRCVLW